MQFVMQGVMEAMACLGRPLGKEGHVEGPQSSALLLLRTGIGNWGSQVESPSLELLKKLLNVALDMVVFNQRLDSMILEVFPNFNDFMIL